MFNGSGLQRLGVGFWLLVAPLVLQAAPQVGDPAPDFSLQGSDGRQHSLSDLRGKKWTVIAFFPKAFTTG